jgi:purine nucleosidase
MSESTLSGRAPFYFDCDPGVDDSLALAYLLAAPDVDLVGVGTVSGNCAVDQCTTNALTLLDLAGRADIPVAKGAHDPLAGAFDGAVPHIHGANGLGGVQFPPPSRGPASETAAHLLIRLAHQWPGELRVVAVGPLTNLALALELDAGIAQLVHSVTLMGGAALVPGNISAVAEANIGNDPEAAAAVLAAPWPVTMAGLDVTMANTFEESHRQALLASGDRLARAVGQILSFYFDFHLAEYGRRASALHDPLAAAIAAGGVKATVAPKVPVWVDTSHGPGRGQTICDLRGQRLGVRDHAGANCAVVLDVDPSPYQSVADHLLAVLTLKDALVLG